MREARQQQVVSRERVTNHGEVYTAEREVNAMLDLVKQETERIDSRFLEPACGNGNFLAEILRRKLAVVRKRYRRSAFDYERFAVVAVSSVYGVDILPDNVDACCERLFGIFDVEYTAVCKKDANDECREAVRFILRRNILCGDALTLKTATGEPIIFSEWSLVTGSLLKRTDYRLDWMLEERVVTPDVPPGTAPGRASHQPEQLRLGDAGEPVEDEARYRVREFPVVHYRRVHLA